jgi:hypothetical protein
VTIAELTAKLRDKKAAQDKARDKWHGMVKPQSTTVKSLDDRVKAIEELLGLVEK